MTTETKQLHMEVGGTVRLNGVDGETLSRLVTAARARARELEERGTLAVNEGSEGEVRVAGSVLVALRVLEASVEGERLFPERASSSLIVRAVPVPQTRVVAIGDHLMGASENHPRDDAPLHFRTEYDEADERLEVRLDGSLFATNYLMFLVYMQLTQGRA